MEKLSDNPMPDTIVVTGAAGFIGRALVTRLLKQRYVVHCIDLHPFPQSHPYLISHIGSFSDNTLLDKLLSTDGRGGIIHLASTTNPKISNENPHKDIADNLNGSLILLEAARRHGINRFLFASSGGTIYGRSACLPVREETPAFPLCSYGIVKLAFERYLAMYAQLYGMHTTSLRLANPFGPGQNPHGGVGAVAAFCYRAKYGQPIEIWGDGSIVRDYLYIDDVVEAFLKALQYEGKGDIINISSGRGLSLLDIISTIESQLGKTLSPVLKAGRNFDVPSIILDSGRAREILGWTVSTSLEKGIRETLFSL